MPVSTFDESGRSARIVGYDGSGSAGPGPRVMAADTLQGNAVKNPEGKDLGEIKHIMLDVPTGRIAYAVLSFGGFLGMGDKLFAIPWTALVLDAGRKCFILEASEDRLKQASGFDKDRWPTMADETWARNLHAYYRSKPYWE